MTISARSSSTAAPSPDVPSPADARRFARIAEETMRAPLDRSDMDSRQAVGIGTWGEKRLHATIKRYLCEDTTAHERLVSDMLPNTADTDTPTKKRRRMVADILTDGQIFEVQTGGFFPLRPKIDWYINHTACRVTVVHPIPAVRYLSWIDPTDGHIISRRRSPKRGRVTDIAKELYWVASFIGHPRFSLRILLLEMEEYRMADGWSRDGKRGSNRYERFPTALLGKAELASRADYAHYFLPDGVPSDTPFTAAMYAQATGIRGKATYSILRILTELRLLETTEKIGRSQGFCRAAVQSKVVAQ